jgi:spermidine/putrescine transport system substrate-binding protein
VHSPMRLNVRAAALVFAGLALACGSGKAGASGELFLYNWTSYFPPELLTKFEKETGIHVTTDFYETNEALLADLQAGTGQYDVIVPTDYMIKIMIDKGLLQPIDAPGMANFKNVKKPFDDPWYDPGRKYTAPYMWETTGFIYDSAQVPGGKLEESWKEFFDPRPELVGKVVAIDYEQNLYQTAAFYLGFDPCTENPAEAQKILDLLLAQKPKLAYYAAFIADADPFQPLVDSLVTKKIALYQYWDGGARRLKRTVPTVVFVVPKEGAHFGSESFAIPYGAPHPENARIFINWMMDPQNIAAASNFIGYTNAIAGSEKYMDSDLIADQEADPSPEMKKRWRFVHNCSQAAHDLSDKVWARLWPRTIQ